MLTSYFLNTAVQLVWFFSSSALYWFAESLPCVFWESDIWTPSVLIVKNHLSFCSSTCNIVCPAWRHTEGWAMESATPCSCPCLFPSFCSCIYHSKKPSWFSTCLSKLAPLCQSFPPQPSESFYPLLPAQVCCGFLPRLRTSPLQPCFTGTADLHLFSNPLL